MESCRGGLSPSIALICAFFKAVVSPVPWLGGFSALGLIIAEKTFENSKFCMISLLYCVQNLMGFQGFIVVVVNLIVSMTGCTDAEWMSNGW